LNSLPHQVDDLDKATNLFTSENYPSGTILKRSILIS